jgi:hypothetical protein
VPKRLIVLLLLALAAAGCTTVQPWERGRLSMEAMSLGDDRTQVMERSIEVYREGAVGANGGKAGGGCGCT